jgi:NAD(P)-dependent dehydrogenase (short-subunit alcohol dehydrogenase family)
MKLLNKTAIISGASQGLGYVIAETYLKEGAQVVLCARNEKHLIEAQKQLQHYVQSPQQITIVKADMAKPDDVNLVYKTAIKNYQQVDVLVANAGILGPKGPAETVDWDEWSQVIDVNLKGVVLQCRSVLPAMKQRKQGKIIILSGGGATKPLAFLSAYGTAKAGVVRFAETLAEEVSAFNIQVNSIAPGAMNTRLLDEYIAAGPEKIGELLYQQVLKQKDNGGVSPQQAANLAVYLATEDSANLSGKLISAVWDPWQKLHLYAEDLKKSDVYTLRRIIPQERDMTWGEVE